MRTLVLSMSILVLVSTHAVAGGIELSANACPDNPGALPTGTVDCAGGSGLVILGTWTPNEAISDLSNLDGSLDLSVQGDLNSSSTFWNWDPMSSCASVVRSNQARPTSGCASPPYLDTWDVADAGTGIGAIQIFPSNERIVFTCYRPLPLTVAAGARLFGVQITIDGRQAVEGGGTCTGCTNTGCLVWLEGRPGSFGASNPSFLYGPDPTIGQSQAITNVFLINGAAACVGIVPVRKQTWGELKSLYR